eukprot:TRINITY_DN5961_c0_g1_i1.p1 TRINITY_DN5961_c0_g1~~TRINITY_DN5961_c0_g1_i1.p1  ORF type:complete len:118 (-),score=39.61 TRINITY_DN5961_c0_g1_i1:45-347(-)
MENKLSVYVRIKRKRQTIFLFTSQEETIQKLKVKIAVINSVQPSDIRLIFRSKVCEDDKTLQENRIESEAILFMVYKKEGIDEWESIDVEKTKNSDFSNE